MYVVKQLEQRVCWSMKIIQLMFLSRQNSLCLFIRLICLFIIQSFLAKSQFLKKYTIIKCNYTFFDCSHFAMKLQLNTATLTLILYLSSDFRVNLSQLIPSSISHPNSQYNNKGQTTTPETSCPTLYDKHAGSFTSPAPNTVTLHFDDTNNSAGSRRKLRRSSLQGIIH